MDLFDFEEEDVPFLQERVKEKGRGQHTCREIMGDYWDLVKHKTEGPKRFKRFVDDKKLVGIRSLGARSDNNQMYEIL